MAYVGTLVAVAALLRVSRLNDSIAEIFSFRQTQTAFVIRGLSRNGYDPFRAELPVLGYPWQVPFEFPAFQMIAAFFVGNFGWDSSLSGRAAGTFFFLLSAVGIYTLALKVISRSVARITLPLFLFTPFAFQWGSASLIEWLPVCAAIGSFICIASATKFNLNVRNSLLLGLGAVLMSIASLSKITTSLVWIFAILGYVLLKFNKKTDPRHLSRFFTIALLMAASLVPAIAWNRFADHVKSENPFTYWLTSENLNEWNFGTIQQRLDVSNWKIVYDRVDQSIVGLTLLFLVLTVIMTLQKNEYSMHAKWISASIFVGPFVFFNLYVVHDYYIVAIYPLVILLIASVIAFIKTIFTSVSNQIAYASVLVIFVATYMSQLGSSYMKNYVHQGNEPAISSILAEHTLPDENIIIIGCDWDPTYLYFADRKGLMLMEGRYSSEAITSETWKTYSFVYLCNGVSRDLLPSSLETEPVYENLYKIVSWP